MLMGNNSSAGFVGGTLVKGRILPGFTFDLENWRHGVGNAIRYS